MSFAAYEEWVSPMFTWVGVLNRSAYVWRAAITIALLVGSILLFPFLAWAIVSASYCDRDTCGAVALAVAFILRPILFIVAMAMALSACVRRARDAGLQPWLGAFPPLMFLADQAFLQYAGAGWAYPFSAGILAFKPPIFALLGTILMALFAVPSPDSPRNGPVVSPDTPLVPAVPSSTALAETQNLWQPARAVLLGVIVAFAVLLWSLLANNTISFPLGLIALPTYVLPFFVPTFLLYTALIASVMRLMARRDAIAAGAVFVALIPFGFWAASLSSVATAKAREREAVAAIPKVALPAKVSAVVVDGDGGWPLINCARSRILSDDYGVDEVLTRGQSQSPYLRFTRETANSPLRKGEAASAAPAEYVLIRFPRRPPFFHDRVLVDIASPPIEIYKETGAEMQLVAARYTVLNPAPTFPPMLTTEGWYSGGNSVSFEKSCESITHFLQRELRGKLSPARS